MLENLHGTVERRNDDSRFGRSLLLLFLLSFLRADDDAADGAFGEDAGPQRVVGFVRDAPDADDAVGADGGHVISSRMSGDVENGEGLQRPANFLGGEGVGARVDGPEDAQDRGVERRPQDEQTVVASRQENGSISGEDAGVDLVTMTASKLADNRALPTVNADIGNIPRDQGGISGSGDETSIR